MAQKPDTLSLTPLPLEQLPEDKLREINHILRGYGFRLSDLQLTETKQIGELIETHYTGQKGSFAADVTCWTRNGGFVKAFVKVDTYYETVAAQIIA